MIHFTVHKLGTGLGLLPQFLDEHNPMTATEQLHVSYAHGGGWHPFQGFRMDAAGNLCYPGDPPLRPLAEAKLRDERIVLYERSWVAVIQPDGYFEVCRMD